MGATLRCSKEAVPVDPEQTLRYRARASDWNYGMEDSRNYNGKAGSCARDLVTECRRCADIICRVSCRPLPIFVVDDAHDKDRLPSEQLLTLKVRIVLLSPLL